MRTKAQDDFFNAFSRMNSKERELLEVFASRCIGGTIYTSPMDIIHEVIIRVMDGRRNWPPDVDLGVFIANCVRSIASNSRKLAEWSNLSLDALSEDDFAEMRSHHAQTMSAEDVALRNERTGITHKAAKFVKATLGEDEQGRQVLEGMLVGLEPEEMCDAFNLSPAAFKAARQRVTSRLKVFGQRNPQ
ncbi:hypothetical protein DBR47_12345 [Paucibacter sp. KBW04]|uniref:sigma-70 family RNA polymerase sigma factor n=1 Tax=Paucibacter sp. KBW04 TaxID=2153361 RepID=UPI000F57DCFF|nr:sigma-70 family RNA polymerase sigma factor [Paucibacter sp. KBW04]RQO58496.1 hypothetical protein DBR47_12345 [Paucibacter sp. KBW04]